MSISKLLTELIYPINQTILLMLAGLFFQWRGRRKLASALFVVALLVIALPSTPLVSDPLVGWLERRYPSLATEDYPRCDAIVVLGGSVQPNYPPRHHAEEMGEARLQQAIRLYRAGKANLLVVSSGPRSASSDPAEPTEALEMKEILVSSGIPASAILAEDQSRNTAENAEETLKLLRDQGCKSLLLVTTAMHLRRAVALFEKGDLEIVPVPCSFRVVESPHGLSYYIPDALTLRRSSLAIKEYVGYLVYQLLGRI